MIKSGSARRFFWRETSVRREIKLLTLDVHNVHVYSLNAYDICSLIHRGTDICENNRYVITNNPPANSSFQVIPITPLKLLPAD